jgi:hypothetical protein
MTLSIEQVWLLLHRCGRLPWTLLQSREKRLCSQVSCYFNRIRKLARLLKVSWKITISCQRRMLNVFVNLCENKYDANSILAAIQVIFLKKRKVNSTACIQISFFSNSLFYLDWMHTCPSSWNLLITHCTRNMFKWCQINPTWFENIIIYL